MRAYGAAKGESCRAACKPYRGKKKCMKLCQRHYKARKVVDKAEGKLTDARDRVLSIQAAISKLQPKRRSK